MPLLIDPSNVAVVSADAAKARLSRLTNPAPWAYLWSMAALVLLSACASITPSTATHMPDRSTTAPQNLMPTPHSTGPVPLAATALAYVAAADDDLGSAKTVRSPEPAPSVQANVIYPQSPLSAPASLFDQTVQNVQPLETPTELWDRIRRGYAMPNLESELVVAQERFYASRPDYIQRMTERSRKYLFHIVEELERRNMPSELSLLPFIESAFNPQAVSTAKAAGMWQFMPATGRDFELKQNVFRDDRRDVLASTRAALDYLQRLHTLFGDWHLALAAYNWGEGSVGRAIARNKRAGLTTGYQDLNMPAETRNYVPKLQAIKNIVGSPSRFNADLPLIENHPYFQEVEIKRDIDVSLAARLADVKIDDFRALNPSASRPVILAAGTRQILLPWDSAEVFKRNFQAHTAGQFASWTAWTVPSTMSVAEAAKRSGMGEVELRAVNSIPPRMLIKAGSALLVTRNVKMNADVSSQVADNGHLGLAPETTQRRTTVKARTGDTVASMAKRHKLSAQNVAEWNKLAANASFKPGQNVVLFVPVRAVVSQASARKLAPKKTVAHRSVPQKVAVKSP